jgi:hypothetical protein
MDIEHFGLLSSVMRKTESHEQDGETLRANARFEAASGDPAMALLFQSVGTDGPFRPAYSAAVRKRPPPTYGAKPREHRARMTARERLQRRMPSLSINVL